MQNTLSCISFDLFVCFPLFVCGRYFHCLLGNILIWFQFRHCVYGIDHLKCDVQWIFFCDSLTSCLLCNLQTHFLFWCAHLLPVCRWVFRAKMLVLKFFYDNYPTCRFFQRFFGEIVWTWKKNRNKTSEHSIKFLSVILKCNIQYRQKPLQDYFALYIYVYD